MRNESDWVILGKIGRPQGLKGLVRVISFTQPESEITTYLPWHIKSKDKWTSLSLDWFEVQNNKILIKITDVHIREDVARLTNCQIGIPSTKLPTLNQGDYYWHELMNMTVCNTDGKLLGNVIDILPTGANDVLVVSGEKRYLIPYVRNIHIIAVDPVKRNIMVDWDENF